MGPDSLNKIEREPVKQLLSVLDYKKLLKLWNYCSDGGRGQCSLLISLFFMCVHLQLLTSHLLCPPFSSFLWYVNVGVAAGSGMAATTMLCQMFKTGDHIVAMHDLYGGKCLLSTFNITN